MAAKVTIEVNSQVKGTVVKLLQEVNNEISPGDDLAYGHILLYSVPRSNVPLDTETIIQSVLKTGALLAVDEDYGSFGTASEIISRRTMNHTHRS